MSLGSTICPRSICLAVFRLDLAIQYDRLLSPSFSMVFFAKRSGEKARKNPRRLSSEKSLFVMQCKQGSPMHPDPDVSHAAPPRLHKRANLVHPHGRSDTQHTAGKQRASTASHQRARGCPEDEDEFGRNRGTVSQSPPSETSGAEELSWCPVWHSFLRDTNWGARLIARTNRPIAHRSDSHWDARWTASSDERDVQSVPKQDQARSASFASVLRAGPAKAERRRLLRQERKKGKRKLRLQIDRQLHVHMLANPISKAACRA